MIKILYCIAILLWVMGVIGGAGYSVYCNAYPIAVGCLLNGYLSFDKIKEMFQKMIM